MDSRAATRRRPKPTAWLPPHPEVREIGADTLAQWLADAPQDTVLLDFTAGVNYKKRHIPGAWFALRSELPAVVSKLGGTPAWAAAGLPLEEGPTRLASPLIGRYRRPYEGTDDQDEAMRAYLDWEFGLVEQLGRDGTHGFVVI